MPVVLKQYIQTTVSADERQQVSAIAQQLLGHLNVPAIQQAIAAANQPGQSSGRVQSTFETFATSLGFRSEARGLFKNYLTTGLRPDY